MMRLLARLVVIVLLFFTSNVHAQELKITGLERQNDNIIIHYDLRDSIPDRVYTINLYASVDDYINPLSEVSGNIGLEVKPGGKRKIIWNAKEELGDAFSGDVSLEMRGRIYIPFIRLDGFGDYKKFKRKKVYKITWAGGRGDQVLNFNVYKGDRKVTAFPNIANVGEYNLKFENIKSGRKYYFKIEDSKNKDDVIITETFKIKAKVPFALKAISTLAVAYVIYVFWPEPDPDPIPEPIKP